MSKIVVDFLNKKFSEKREKNSRFSLRAFAKQLNADHSMLSKILSHKRPLSFELAKQFLDKIEVETALKNDLLLTFSDQKIFNLPIDQSEFEAVDPLDTLTQEELKIFEQWYFNAIRHLLYLDTTQPTTISIAKYLNLPLEQIIIAIDVHKKMGSITEENGILKLQQIENFKKIEIELKHRINAMKNIFQRSIEPMSHEQSEDSLPAEFVITYASTSEYKINEARRKVVNFMSYLMQWLDAEDPDHPKDAVYSLGLQLSPIAVVKKAKKTKPVI